MGWQGDHPAGSPRFAEKMTTTLDTLRGREENANVRAQSIRRPTCAQMLKDKLVHRLGWQPRCKPTVFPGGRILLPLYTDTFRSPSWRSDDNGTPGTPASRSAASATFSRPCYVAITVHSWRTCVKTVLDKIRTSESRDDGETWGPVGTTDFRIRRRDRRHSPENGHWLLIYNDTSQGRNSLAGSISEDEGKTWPITRHLETRAILA